MLLQSVAHHSVLLSSLVLLSFLSTPSLSHTQRLPLSNAFPLIIHIIVTLTFSLSLSPSHHHPVSTLLPISGNRLSLTQRLLALQKTFPLIRCSCKKVQILQMNLYNFQTLIIFHLCQLFKLPLNSFSLSHRGCHSQKLSFTSSTTVAKNRNFANKLMIFSIRLYQLFLSQMLPLSKAFHQITFIIITPPLSLSSLSSSSRSHSHCSQPLLSLTEAATLKSFPSRHPLELQKMKILQMNLYYFLSDSNDFPFVLAFQTSS